MKYLFGPVNSRRFGLSLGIDLSPDKKSCNFDCLYCELDKAKPVSTIQNEPNPDEIVAEVKHFLQKNPYPEVITITANGEPTLYSKLDVLIEKLQKIKGNSQLLILSNGSTIHKKEIQEALKNLDIVKISLDAADQRTFQKVNKTLKGIKVENIIQGLQEFRKIFKGTLVIEILVVKNVNDSPENIKKIAEVLKDIKPDRVDLGTVDRPPAYRVFPVSDEELLKLGECLKDFNLNIITRGKDNILSEFQLSEEEILNTFKRRPYTYSDIEKVFNQETVNKIKDMISNGKLIEKKVGNTFFILPG
ncbi:radical SAM protein [Persephonella sp.]|uniref:radical SAM protein n=1 Tax=Persephonella sp. TaxID=2060922 RepID=UPI00260E81FB|nr:radical SAM protein [Persephonella sp.]